jgi:tripartite-type tricarboxylate transporter receptor subunit TctC
VQFICVTTSDVAALVQAHKVRVLAVTSDHHVPSFPDVPTMEELGYKNFVAASWNAYLVPATTPDPIVASLSKAYLDAANDPDVKAQFSNAGIELHPMSPSDLAKFIHDDTNRWHQVVEENHIKLESGN